MGHPLSGKLKLLLSMNRRNLRVIQRLNPKKFKECLYRHFFEAINYKEFFE